MADYLFFVGVFIGLCLVAALFIIHYFLYRDYKLRVESLEERLIKLIEKYGWKEDEKDEGS